MYTLRMTVVSLCISCIIGIYYTYCITNISRVFLPLLWGELLCQIWAQGTPIFFVFG